MKKILVIILFSLINLFAQDSQKQNPGVQLPDFVITGKDVISVENAKKIPPPFIPTVSGQFFKPAFSPEDLQIKNVSIPIKGSVIQNDSLNYFKGRIEGGMGLYANPFLNLNYSQPFANGMLEGYASGFNQKAIPNVNNSQKYSIKGGANLLLFVKENSGFLPGTHFKFGGDYSSLNYYLYNSQNPILKSTALNLSEGHGYVKIENLLSKYLIFSGIVEDNITDLKSENLSENLMNVEGFAKMGFPTFYVGASASFKKQFLTDSSSNNVSNYYYLAARPFAELNVTDLLRASFGINYAQVRGDNLFSIYASGVLKLGNGLSLFGEFSPGTEFLTPKYFLDINPYFRPQNFNNLFLKKNAAINAYLKYEYYRFFEIDGGVKFYNAENLPYFTDASSKGEFMIKTASAKSYSAFVNLLFHLGPYGRFYGTVEANRTQDTAVYFIPYFPQFKTSLNYGYNFSTQWYGEMNLKYNTGSYIDIQNTKSLSPYFNLGVKLSYQLNPGFLLTLQLSNLINNKNYLWNGYQDIPLNIVGGLTYQF